MAFSGAGVSPRDSTGLTMIAAMRGVSRGPKLVHASPRTITALARALPNLTEPVIYARILWDGLHGEPVKIDLSRKLVRLLQREQRRMKRYPALYRQFHPRRLKRD